jgi:alpha/beta superfamily hydrolase
MFIGDNPRLEAAFDEIADARCAVITHPHPLYGGNMHNNVVMACRDAALANGYSALRFNFRGTGRSEGRYDDGKGEVNDLHAAISFAGGNPIIIGYSFGAWIASMYLEKLSLPSILISPPTAMFEVRLADNKDVWVIASDNDQYSDISKVKTLVPVDRLFICRGIDHFWFGDEDILIGALNKAFAGLKGPE